MNNEDLKHLLNMYSVLQKLGVFRYHMSQDQNWRGGFWWPSC
jgi:hypothetical protein